MTDKLRALLVPVLTALVAAGAMFIFMNRNGTPDTTPVQENVSQENGGSLVVGYATEGVTAVTNDPDEFNKAVDEAFRKAEARKGMALKYQYDAISADGVNFNCLLANSADNDDDMFIAIYTDSTFQEELFLSELLKPGTAFEKITLNRPLEKGSHNVVAAFTLVKTDENGQQSISQQRLIGLRLIVR